jgi:hypothetical protein
MRTGSAAPSIVGVFPAKSEGDPLSDVEFTAEAVKAKASEGTGLDNFGSADYQQGLTVLLDTYHRNLIDPQGRRRCFKRVVTLLETRLRVQAAFERLPEIRERDVRRPMIVTGLPRTGTSALFNLLDADPAARGLLQWETHFPDPLPGMLSGDPDPRHDALAKALDEQRAKNPEFTKIHFSSADTPEECVLAHAIAMDGAQLGFEIMLEPYGSWFKNHDLGPMYRYYRDLLKMLDWRHPNERRLLKSPAHMWAVDTVVDTFPDACLVWGHRDPLEVVPSICSLTEMVMGMYMGPDCPAAQDLGPLVMDWYASSLERGFEARARLDDGCIVDYGFREFVDDPMATVEKIYDHFDLAMPAESRHAIQAYIAANPKGKHGKHEYDHARYGLSEAKINERFAFYLEDTSYRIS